MDNPEGEPHPTKHELREQKREERKEQRKSEEEKKQRTEKIGKYGIYALIVVIIIGIGFGVYKFAKSSDKKIIKDDDTGNATYLNGPIHWHVQVDVSICGESELLPRYDESRQSHLGEEFLHTHNDDRVHIEVPPGARIREDKATIGAFFDAIGVPFSNETIMDKKNGDLCTDGKPGKVKFFVVGLENNEFREYPIVDGEIIEIRFE